MALASTWGLEMALAVASARGRFLRIVRTFGGCAVWGDVWVSAHVFYRSGLCMARRCGTMGGQGGATMAYAF